MRGRPSTSLITGTIVRGAVSESGDIFVRIGNREVYDELQEIKKVVLRMEGALGNVVDDAATTRKRVGKLEFRYYAILAGLVGTLGSVVVGLGAATGAIG